MTRLLAAGLVPIAAIGVLLAAPGRASDDRASPACAPQVIASYRAHGPGPLTLTRVDCERPDWSGMAAGVPALSPDGKWVASYDSAKRVLVAGTRRGVRNYPIDLGVSASFGGMSDDTRGAFAWNRNSATLWTAQQDRIRPEGWATGPMRPMRARPDGTLEPLPPLTHNSGPLDRLLWIGGVGLALAQFGTSGTLYKPEHADRAPMLAFVDAARGRVLETLPFDRIADLDKSISASSHLSGAAATLMPDGRARAVLLTYGRWTVWTQGSAPRSIANRYKGQKIGAAISRNGRLLLVTRALPSETICPRAPPCKAGSVNRGPIADLLDLDTGRLLWTLDGEGASGSGSGEPSFSPDGRYVLLPLPANDRGHDLGLVSVADGRVVQTIGGGSRHAGFLDSGRVWVARPGVIAFYDLRPRRRR